MIELLERGGPVMAAIVIASTAAWTLAIAKLMALSTRARDTSLEIALEGVRRGALEEAARAARGGGELGALVAHGLAARDADRAAFDRRMRLALDADARRLESGLPLIGALAASVTLLGLLGTVLGMVASFAGLSERGVHAATVAGGISQALTTTQAGLLAGVPILVLHGFIGARARRLAAAGELAVRRLEAAIFERGGRTS